jgi:hypothetical protein
MCRRRRVQSGQCGNAAPTQGCRAAPSSRGCWGVWVNSSRQGRPLGCRRPCWPARRILGHAMLCEQLCEPGVQQGQGPPMVGPSTSAFLPRFSVQHNGACVRTSLRPEAAGTRGCSQLSRARSSFSPPAPAARQMQQSSRKELPPHCCRPRPPARLCLRPPLQPLPLSPLSGKLPPNPPRKQVPAPARVLTPARPPPPAAHDAAAPLKQLLAPARRRRTLPAAAALLPQAAAWPPLARSRARARLGQRGWCRC